jgi:hypothetical protein
MLVRGSDRYGHFDDEPRPPQKRPSPSGIDILYLS